MKKILIILILILLINCTSAGLTDSARDAVSNGFSDFFIKLADGMFSISLSPIENTEGGNAVDGIYYIASYNVDPGKIGVLNQFKDFSGEILKSGYKMVIGAALIAALIMHFRVGIAQKFEEITGFNIGEQENILLKKALYGILLALFIYVFIYFILLLNLELTKAVLLETLDVIAPSPDNVVLYFIMGLGYLFLAAFFGLRILIICLFYAFAFIIALCLMIDYTKQSAENVCAYFVQTVFFQFIIVAYFSVCILLINALSFPPDFERWMYVLMLIGSVYLAIKLMIGTSVIRWAGRRAAYALI